MKEAEKVLEKRFGHDYHVLKGTDDLKDIVDAMEEHARNESLKVAEELTIKLFNDLACMVPEEARKEKAREYFNKEVKAKIKRNE